MELIAKLIQEAGQPLKGGAKIWGIDDGGHSRVVHAFRCDFDDPFAVRLSQAAGVVHWERFWRLSDGERRQLELEEGRWILCARPAVEGTALSALSERAVEDWPRWALALAHRLRTLHAQKYVHGRLNPDALIVDGAGRIWLKDLPLVSTPLDLASHPDLAPYAAPELWEGEAPREGSDVYALSVLICWMASGGRHPLYAEKFEDWPHTHRSQSPDIPGVLAGRLAGAVKRGLLKRPDTRPPIQLLIEALQELVADQSPPFVPLPPSLYRGMERTVFDELEGGTRAIFLYGEEGTGKTFALKRLHARCELAGQRTVFHSPQETHGPGIQRLESRSGAGDPWEPLRCLIRALDEKVSEQALVHVTGDRQHVFHTWARRLEVAMGRGTTTVFWDDLDSAGPDIRAFWPYCLQRLVEGEEKTDRRLRFVASGTTADKLPEGLLPVPMVGPDPTVWHGWRGRTLLAQVRQIESEDWAAMVDQWGRQPVRLFEAINQHLAVDSLPDFAIRAPKKPAMRDVSVIFAGDWRRHLEGLMTRGAYMQALITARRLFEVLARSGREERTKILEYWLEALIRAGLDDDEVDRFEQVLVQARQSDDLRELATFLRGRLSVELGNFDEGLSYFEETSLSDGRPLLWQVCTHLIIDDNEGARRCAQRATADQDMPAEVRNIIELLARAAAAMEGDREILRNLDPAISELSGDGDFVRLRALCHRCCGLGWTSLGQFDRAGDSFLKALHEIEEAGFAASLAQPCLDAGDTFARQDRLELAFEYYQRGLQSVTSTTSAKVTARLLLGSAEMALVLQGADQARPLIEQAQALTEAAELFELRARADELAERARRRDQQPEEEAVDIPPQPPVAGEGLQEIRDELFELRDELAQLQLANRGLEETNQELRERLDEREDRVVQLERRGLALELALDEERRAREEAERRYAQAQQRAERAESGATAKKKRSRRGRKPKAKRQQVQEALEVCEHDFDAAAELLGVSKRTLYRYVNRYELET